MRQIAIASGKGGTGKTTLTACFATLAERVVAVDCDVDAANLAILLAGKDIVGEPFVSGIKAEIDEDACAGCGACALECRFDAIEPTPDFGYRVDPTACEGCRVCSLVCPSDAVSFRPNVAGRWMIRDLGPMSSKTNAASFLAHAALGVAQDNSGKLVARLREEAEAVAGRAGIELLLLDGPPGLGCPVHATLTRTDQLVAVTEASPSGEHDLLRLLGLAEHFRLPAGVIINRYDLAPAESERIERACEAQNVPVVGRIPFDRAVPAMLAQRRLPLGPPVGDATVAAIVSAWARIRDMRAPNLQFGRRRMTTTPGPMR